MEKKSNIVRVAIILAILVSGLTLAVSPGAALEGIPSGATITSATLNIFANNVDPAGNTPVNVHQATAPWDEATVTWNSFGASYAPAVIDSFTPPFAGWQTADVTALVQAWVDGTAPNNGLLLEQGLTSPAQSFFSSEWSDPAYRPYLFIRYTAPGIAGELTATLQAVGDAYIFEGTPDTNYGTWVWLYTGWWMETQLEKQSLIQFEMPEVPEGCTLTPGYWKTHSIYGPAPYDATWAQIGEDTPFFTSGQSYYEVLWTEPKGGNAYYILAHAYIAAELNFLNGADPTAAQAAFDAATALFGMYDDSIPKKDPNRAVAIGLAETLDNYNNGIIGPGHCLE